MNIKSTFLLIVATIFSASVFAQINAKDIVNTWKLIKVEKNGEAIEPEHQHLTVEITKKNTFVITSAEEETHYGTWSLDEEAKKLVLLDTIRDYKQELDVLDLDKGHLAVGNLDGKDVTVYMIPLGKKKHADLNHVEHSIAKKWTCFKSDKESNKGLIIEFKEDHTFLLIPEGAKIPAATGTWKLNEDKTKILIEKKDGGHLELLIVERHSHELVLLFEESEMTNYFHDPKLTVTDIQDGVLIHGNKQQHESVD